MLGWGLGRWVISVGLVLVTACADDGGGTGSGGTGSGGTGSGGTGSGGTGSGGTGSGGTGSGGTGSGGTGSGGMGSGGTGSGGTGSGGTGSGGTGSGGMGSGGDGTCVGGFRDGAADLCWQEPSLDTARTFEEAVAYCEGLVVEGQQQWRVPSVTEARSLIRNCPQAAPGGACPIDEGSESSDFVESCQGCEGLTCTWPNGLTGECGQLYWTTTEVADYPGSGIWIMQYASGTITWDSRLESFRVRCVRDAP